MKVERVLVQAITVSLRHRKVNPAIVDGLCESMGRVGMLSPILVRLTEREDVIHLSAGRHRLEAAKRLGWNLIDAYCFTGDDAEARMREITENLHRSELTVLERSEQIEEWRVLCEQSSKDAQVAHPGGKQPKQRGISQAAKELGTTREEVQRAEKIASITPAAKEAAKEAGIDDSQSKLLKVAAAEPEKQVDAVKEAAKKERAKRSAAAKKGVEKAAETRRRKNADKAEAREREIEVVEREMGELASRLIGLDRDLAHAVYQVMRKGWHYSGSFEYALEDQLGLTEEIPDDEQKDTSDDTTVAETTAETTAAETTTDTSDDRWTESDNLNEIRSGGLQ